MPCAETSAAVLVSTMASAEAHRDLTFESERPFLERLRRNDEMAY